MKKAILNALGVARKMKILYKDATPISYLDGNRNLIVGTFAGVEKLGFHLVKLKDGTIATVHYSAIRPVEGTQMEGAFEGDTITVTFKKDKWESSGWEGLRYVEGKGWMIE